MVHPIRSDSVFRRPDTLTAVVSQHIGEAVVRGEYPPGAPLPEVALAQSFGVARGTVREALRKLQNEGFVEIIPHRGAFVASLTTSRVQELGTVRMLVEGYAARAAVERGPLTKQALDEIAEALDALRQAAAADGPIADFVDADMRFHEVVSRQCGDDTILSLLEGTGRQTRRLLIVGNVYDGSDWPAEIVEHERLFDVLQRGHPDEVEAAFRSHIGRALDILMARFRERQ